VTFAERSDRPLTKGLTLTCSQAAAVQDIGNLLIAMVVKQTVDVGHDVGLEFANVGDG
jgi:hypothetical protein